MAIYPFAKSVALTLKVQTLLFFAFVKKVAILSTISEVKHIALFIKLYNNIDKTIATVKIIVFTKIVSAR